MFGVDFLNFRLLPKENGFFIEAGAFDGYTISNSLLFEVGLNWTGLLVEPNPDAVEQLLKVNRKAWVLPHCFSTKVSETSL